MPFYHLKCQKCGHDFTARASIADKTQQRIACPSCTSTQLQTVYDKNPNIYVKKAQGACPNRERCGGCCHK